MKHRTRVPIVVSAVLLLLLPAAAIADQNDSPARKGDKAAATNKADKDESSGKKAKNKDKKKEQNKETNSKKSIKLASIAIRGGLSEAPSQPGLFGELEPNLREMKKRLAKAAEDEDIEAVVLRLRNPDIGYGRINEMRTSIKSVRDAGKRVIAQLESSSTQDYLLACACDEIVMPETGFLYLPGVRAEAMFFKNMLDKLGVDAEFMHMGEAKGAGEPFTRESMSPPVKKNISVLVDDLYEQMVETIADDRKLDKQRVRGLIDQGLFTAASAKDAGLIDTITYEDELRERIRRAHDAKELTVDRNYGKKSIDTDFSGPTGMFKLLQMMMGIPSSDGASADKQIALIHAIGPIMTGKSEVDLFGAQTIGSDTIVAALRKAAKNDKVVAVVLRVDSPGGSAVASDMIWREVVRLEKPVIACMGDTAASGGYYISMGADKIYAEPGTITGSIGVVTGKFALGGLYDKIGVSTDVIARGKNSGLFSSTDKFTDSEREAMQHFMADIYEQFTTKAAEGRNMPLDKLKKLAGGKVYTGRVAKQHGLVDELGTLDDAIAAAKKAAGVDADEETDILLIPEPKSFLDQLFETTDENVSLGAAQQLLDMPVVGEALREVRLLERMFREPAVFTTPYRLKVR